MEIRLVDKEYAKVQIINSIKKRYPHLRQNSKPATFALTYGGTAHTLIKNLGMSEEEAKEIEDNYHALYKESDEWVKEKLEQACKDGYVTLAFGLMLRTPVLAKSFLNDRRTINQAKAEARSAGNAVSGQSYGMLTQRAAIEFMQRVEASEWRGKVLPCALIHDAIYLLIENSLECLTWVNKNLTECMAWQELPELVDPDIKIHAELDVFYPDWSKSITLPSSASEKDIQGLIEAYKEKL